MKYSAVSHAVRGVLLSAGIACSAQAEVTDHAAYRFAFDRADREMRDTIRTTGVAGMKSGIERCYRRFSKSKSEETLIYCFAMHRVAGDLDGAFSAVNNLDAQDQALTRGAALLRAARSLKRLGYSEERSYQIIAAWAFYGYERR